MSCNLTFTPLLCKKAEEYFEAARPFFAAAHRKSKTDWHSALRHSRSA